MTEVLQKLEVSNVRRFKPYPAYKPSGVDWLGSIPEHWDVKKLRYVARLRSGDNITSEQFDDDGAYPVFGGNGVRGCSSHFTHDGRFVLIGRQGALCGNVNYASGKFWASEHAVVVSPLTEFATVWMGELLRTMNLNQYSVSAAQPGLSVDAISALKIPVPPSSDQGAIADFLDCETAKIDALILKKQTLIEKVQEKRSALVSRTVTRGLPPDSARAAGLNPLPPIKASGIDWFGEVPAHWKEMMLKRAWATADYGLSDALTGDGPIKVLTMGNIQEGQVHLPENGALEEVEENMLVKDGDLLFNRTNSLAHVGKVGICRGIADERVTFASYLVRIRTNRHALPAFLNFLLNTPQQLAFLRCLALPSINQANLNPTRYGQIRVFLPPIREQQIIIDFLDQETATLNDMVRKVGAAIARLEEYRATLISAAVTGKIDVRGVAA